MFQMKVLVLSEICMLACAFLKACFIIIIIIIVIAAAAVVLLLKNIVVSVWHNLFP